MLRKIIQLKKIES